MVPSLDENQLELATVDYFCELGYDYIQGPAIAPDGLPAARLPEGQGQAEPATGRAGVRSCACVPVPGNLLYSPH